MAGLEVKTFAQPDEAATPDALTRFETVTYGSWQIQRSVHQPGWQWSEHRGQALGVPSCGNTHVIYIVAGRFGARMEDGTEAVLEPGAVVYLGPGHDLWVIGDEPAIQLNLASGAQAPTYPA